MCNHDCFNCKFDDCVDNTITNFEKQSIPISREKPKKNTNNYLQAHPDKKKEYQRRYREKNKQKLAVSSKEYYQQNKDRINQKNKERNQRVRDNSKYELFVALENLEVWINLQKPTVDEILGEIAKIKNESEVMKCS